MRKVIPVIAMLIGAIALFIGIGQKTFWAPPETVTASMPAFEGTAPLTVVEPSINDPEIAPVELKIQSEGAFTASLGRSYDVEAWVADAQHISLTGIDREVHQLQAELVEGEAEVPNPAGADIFFDSQDAEGEMTYRWTAPDNGSWSLLLAADGKAAAPATISVTYLNDATMPWALPLIIVGILLIVGGVALLVIRPSKSTNRTQHSLALVAILGLGLSGVMIPAAPSEDASESPSESAEQSEQSTEEGAESSAPASEEAEDSAQPTEEAQPSASEVPAEQTTTTFPVITEEQLERILADTKSVVAKADESHEAKDLEARAAGGFRWMRDKRYSILKEDIEIAQPDALNTEVVRSAAVPNTSEAKFPRVINVVTAKDSDPNTLPTAMTLIQNGPRDNYKVVFASQMLPASSFPGIAVGDPAVKQMAADVDSLSIKPQDAVKQLAEVLTDEKSEHAERFAESEFIKAIHAGQKAEKEAANEANVKYTRKASDKETYVLSTPDGGAIVTGMINSTTTFERTEDSDPLEGTDELTKALLGSSSSRGDVAINYAEPVMFYIPAGGSEDKVQLIAGEVALLEVKQVEED
ncbi:hypothetical protein [Glutamicibacter uratoxydans]|uniref:hypothetical protein n=1 Tax=Glutamicibacter uratoxydans TaxID=43667 RepID=UPI003D6DB8DE